MDNHLKVHESVITSILRSAEERIYNMTGLDVTASVEVNDKSNAIDDFISKKVQLFCVHWKIDHKHLYKKTRQRDIVAMRTIMFHYLRTKYRSISLINIGGHFGEFDHSTVLHGIRNANNFLQTKDEFFNLFFEPIKHLYND